MIYLIGLIAVLAFTLAYGAAGRGERGVTLIWSLTMIAAVVVAGRVK